MPRRRLRRCSFRNEKLGNRHDGSFAARELALASVDKLVPLINVEEGSSATLKIFDMAR